MEEEAEVHTSWSSGGEWEDRYQRYSLGTVLLVTQRCSDALIHDCLALHLSD